MQKKELINLLKVAADYFSKREFASWEEELRDSIEKIENDDFSVIESLYLKYSPTGEIDELFITHFPEENEERVNTLNDQLAEVVNRLFWALDKAKSEIT